jgi:hypothetical protein
LARQDLFEPDFGPLNFFVLEFGPFAKKVGHPCSNPGVANLFGKWAKFKNKKVQRAKIWFKEALAGQIFSLFKAN